MGINIRIPSAVVSVAVESGVHSEISIYETRFRWNVSVDTWEENNFKAIGVIEKNFVNWSGLLPNKIAYKLMRRQINKFVEAANTDLKERGHDVAIPKFTWTEEDT